MIAVPAAPCCPPPEIQNSAYRRAVFFPPGSRTIRNEDDVETRISLDRCTSPGAVCRPGALTGDQRLGDHRAGPHPPEDHLLRAGKRILPAAVGRPP